MAEFKHKLIGNKQKFVEDPANIDKVFFVSSAYSGYSSPYYSTIQSAINDCDGTNYFRIIVEKGSYIETITMKNRVLVNLNSGVRIAPSPGNSGIIYSSDCSDSTITGYGKLQTDIASVDTTKYSLITYNGATHHIELDEIRNDGNKALPIHLYGVCALKIREISCPIQIQGSATGIVETDIIDAIKNSGNMLVITKIITGQVEQDADKLVLKFHKSNVTSDIAFQIDGGELIIDGGRLESYTDFINAPIVVNGGLVRVHNCYIKNINTSGNVIHNKFMDTGHLVIVQNSVLIAGTGGANAIKSDYSPQNALIYGSVVSNKDKDINTSLVGGVISVNSAIK